MRPVIRATERERKRTTMSIPTVEYQRFETHNAATITRIYERAMAQGYEADWGRVAESSRYYVEVYGVTVAVFAAMVKGANRRPLPSQPDRTEEFTAASMAHDIAEAVWAAQKLSEVDAR